MGFLQCGYAAEALCQRRAPHHYGRTPVQIERARLHPVQVVDLAVLETGFVPIGDYLDDSVGDDLVLSKALLIGYSPTPRIGSLVAVARGRLSCVSEIRSSLDFRRSGRI